MTREEWLVIAAAAAAFVIINIIMWTVIAIKEKREKRHKAVPPDISKALLKASEELESLGDPSVERAAMGIGFEDTMPSAPVIRRRDDFTVTTTIIMVYTSETID